MKKKKSGIYVIERVETGQKYVGLGKKVEQRMNMYHNGSDLLNRAIEKYEEENFKRYVIERCSIGELPEKEKYWIKELHSHMSEGGYNMTWGGDAPMEGKHHSEEWKKNASKRMSGENNPFYGKTHSEESIQKIREANTNPSAEKRVKLGNGQRGKHHSEETKRKIGESNKGRIISENQIRLLKDRNGEKNPNFGNKTGKSSEYYSVSISDRKRHYFRSIIKLNGKIILIGHSKNEIELAKKYDKYIIEHNFPNPLNFPKEWGREK